MKNIRIIVNNLELDIVKESFSLTSENNALSTGFKGIHSSYPLLVLENQNTQRALGAVEISSVLKKKTFDVTVFVFGQKFYGKLQILTQIKGFRKCNLKFFSKIIAITEKSLSEFMPIVSIIPGETNPTPYTTTSQEPLSGSEHWKTYPVAFLSKSFPAVKWQFPTLSHSKYAGNPDFASFIATNMYSGNEFLINYTELKNGTVTVVNKNAPSPQVYLLTPLYYALESIGYKMKGSFVSHPLITKLLMLSMEDNLCQTPASVTLSTLSWHNSPWINYSPGIQKKEARFTIPYAGTYVIWYDLQETPPWNLKTPGVSAPFHMTLGQEWLGSYNTALMNTNIRNKGYITINIPANKVGEIITLSWLSSENRVPQHTISVTLRQNATLYQMHPTIELKRYIPDWTFGDYINQLKNTFNLSIVVDDVLKTMSLNLNENDTNREVVEIVKSSHFIKEYNLQSNDGFILGYDNQEDNTVLVTKEGVVTNGTLYSDFVLSIKNKFKKIPNYLIKEDIINKKGVGIMIYDPQKKPYIADNFNGFTLDFPEKGGIYQTFWRKWLKYRLNAGLVSIDAVFTETEISRINQATALYIDYRLYRVVTLVFSATPQNLYKVKMDLETVSY